MVIELAVACLLVGDSIAKDLGPYLNCKVSAQKGLPSSRIVERVHPAPLVIISAGSNDDSTNLKALYEIRVRAGFSKVVWILPANPAASAAVWKVGAMAHDARVFFIPGPDHVHPRSNQQLAKDIKNAVQTRR